MSYTYKEIVASRSPEKRLIDKQDIWVFLFVRPVSFLVTWLVMKLKISANQATLISTIISVVGSLLLITTSKNQTMIALIILNFWIVFDCVDGNIARVKKESSLYGEFLDGVSGYIFTSLLYIFLSVNVYLNTDYGNKWVFIVMGALTSLATIFPRLVEHKANNMFDNYEREVTDRKNYSLPYILGLNIAGMAGLANPLMIVCHLFGKLEYYLLAYFIIHGGIAFLSTIKILLKVRK